MEKELENGASLPQLEQHFHLMQVNLYNNSYTLLQKKQTNKQKKENTHHVTMLSATRNKWCNTCGYSIDTKSLEAVSETKVGHAPKYVTTSKGWPKETITHERPQKYNDVNVDVK